MGQGGPTLFPPWTATVGTMVDAGRRVLLMCTTGCSRQRAPNLRALAEAKGPEFMLQNRRFACR